MIDGVSADRRGGRPVTLCRMAYLMRGMDESGSPVDVVVEGCWRCGAMINTMLMSLNEHVEVAHPLPEQGRHVLRDDR